METNLHPLANAAAPGLPQVGGADVLLNLNLGFDATNLDFTVNGVTFVTPSVPVLLQILSGTLNAQDLLPAGSVYSLPPNKVVELSIPAGVAGGPVRSAFEGFVKISMLIQLCVSASFPFARGKFQLSGLYFVAHSANLACLLCRSQRWEYSL